MRVMRKTQAQKETVVLLMAMRQNKKIVPRRRSVNKTTSNQTNTNTDVTLVSMAVLVNSTKQRVCVFRMTQKRV